MNIFKWFKRKPPKDMDCPFCGGKETVKIVGTKLMGDVVPYEWVQCSSCGRAGYGGRL